MSLAFEGVHEMSIGLSTSVNSTCGSQDDYGKLTGLDCGSFGSPLFVKKFDDQVNSFFIIVNIIFVFHFFNFFVRIIVYVLSGLIQFCLWF